MFNKRKYIYYAALFISFLLLSQQSLAEGKRIIKWVDSNGVTHYGDQLPPQQAGKNNVQVRHNGIVVEKEAPLKNNKEKSQDQDKLTQQHKDHILLSSYTNAEEIDLACKRNLEMANATLLAVTVQKGNITERIERNHKEVKAYQTKNKPLPAALSENMEITNAQSKKLDNQIATQTLKIEAIKNRYEKDKIRFIELKEAQKNN